MKKIIDDCRQYWQNKRIAFNQAIGFSSLNNMASKPPLSARVFPNTSVPQRHLLRLHSPIFAFLRETGAGDRFGLLVSCCQSANLSFVSPLMFSSVRVGLINQHEKANSMNPASFGASMRRVSMRKGFQRPLSVQSLRTFPTLNEAHRFTQWRLKSHVGYRFAIWQNLDDTWVVGRVMNPN